MRALNSAGLVLMACMATGVATAGPNLIQDGDFEGYTSLVSYQTGPGGEKWGKSWCYWSTAGDCLTSSWQNNNSSGAWSGGQVDRTEDFAAGWKWARSGVIFGIIKDRMVMSQTFTFTGFEVSSGQLKWWDANRPSWRDNEIFGQPNPYKVTLTDNLGNQQVIGEYESKVASNLSEAEVLANTYADRADDRWSDENKKKWFEKAGLNDFTLIPGRTYTLSFNSMSPPCPGGQNCDPSAPSYNGFQDRTTFLDDIVLTAQPLGGPDPSTQIPVPGSLLLLGLGGVLPFLLRRRPT